MVTIPVDIADSDETVVRTAFGRHLELGRVATRAEVRAALAAFVVDVTKRNSGDSIMAAARTQAEVILANARAQVAALPPINAT